MRHKLSALLSVVCLIACQGNKVSYTDILVVGGGASGVAASVQAARLGSDVILLEESPWLGGMLTSAGVSAIDGNYNLRSGFWGEFLDSLVFRYGSLDALKTGWVSNVQFEPSVANGIFHNMVAERENISLHHGWHASSVSRMKNGRWLLEAQNDEGLVMKVNAAVVIDATELGDIAAVAGVPYDKGMESRYSTLEEIAPESENDIIQDLTYVAILKDFGHPVPMEKPKGYSADKYACCCANPLCVNPPEPDRVWSKEMMMTYGALPGGKYMINWPIEGNDFYLDIIEMNREERENALEAAKLHTLGMVYFMKTELGYENLALADDEYPTEDRLPFIPYHRESRRIHGVVRFTYNHIQNPFAQDEPLYRTSIAVGDYPVDHHHGKYSGEEKLPRLYFCPIPSFGLPLGTLLPEGFDNFIVAEKSISVSNIANGCTRLQPVVMQIGTAAGTIASLAVKENISVADVSVRDVQNAILESGGYLQPYLDVEKSSPEFVVYQRIGSTGLLKGEGKHVDWSNQFWLRTEDPLLFKELDDIRELYPDAVLPEAEDDAVVTVAQAKAVVASICDKEICWGGLKDGDEIISRGEYAELLDSELDPFNSILIGIDGKVQ